MPLHHPFDERFRRRVELMVMRHEVCRDAGVERVAVLTAGRNGLVLVALPNVHPQPRDHFRVEVKDMAFRVAAVGGSEVIALVHSHPVDHVPDQLPSFNDLRVLPAKQLGIIVAPKFHTVCWYQNGDIIRQPRIVVASRL